MIDVEGGISHKDYNPFWVRSLPSGPFQNIFYNSFQESFKIFLVANEMMDI